jgi:hypothetical protein
MSARDGGGSEAAAMNALNPLAAFHAATFVVGLILLFTIPAAGVCVFAPVVFAQLGLINTWLAFGQGKWEERCGIWAMAMFLVTLPLMCFPFPLAALHAAGLGLVRWRLAGLYYYLDDPGAGAARRLQFSLRRLMLATLAVSVAFAAARALKSIDDSRMELALLLATSFAVAMVAGLLCSHAFALWAVLGTERPAAGIAASVAVATGLGGLLAFAVDGPIPPRLALPALFAVQQAIYAVSLMVIRNLGYRLFHHPRPAVAPPATEDEIRFLNE